MSDFPSRGSSSRMAFRPGDAAHNLGIGKTQLYQLIRSGELELVKLSARTSVIPADSLLAFLERRRAAQVSP